MVRASEIWRRFGTALFVVGLSVQFTAIGLSPTWGAVLPHAHITNGNLTAAEWEDHAHEHRLGVSGRHAYDAGCLMPIAQNRARVIASLPDADGILSFLPAFAAALFAQRTEIPACHSPSARVLARTFVARDRFDPLHKPPPNA